MKKRLSLLLFFCVFASFSQTKIVSTGLELKKSTYYHQLISTVHSLTDEFYVLASDKDNATLLKYNSALFFSDSLQIKTDKNYPNIVGNSFNHKRNIVFYYTSDDFKKFKAVTYDFNERKTATVTFDVPLTNENIIATFSKNDQLYFLTYLKTDKQLKLYTFRGNRYDEKVLDLDPFRIYISKENSLSIAQYIGTNPIEVVDIDFFNPLFSSANKIKIYPLKEKLLFTLDHASSQTQALEIDWTTYVITEKLFPQPTLVSGVGGSNSFYHQEKLYQFKANESQLVLAKHDYQRKEPILEYSVLGKESISFKNSPLYSQNGDYPAKKIKNTEKFLNLLKKKSLGITVYRTQDDLLITVGGTNETVTSDGLVVGALVTIGGIMLGGDGTVPDLSYAQILQNVYFECRFDDEFKPKELPFSPLAVDFISGFLKENNLIMLHNTTKYKDYFIFSYYDSKAKQLVLRKFEDGYTF
jgi:hypothetical protein